MIFEILFNAFKFIGYGNFIAIMFFTLSTTIAYFFYFKTFYRLVYSLHTLYKSQRESKSESSDKKVDVSRIIFYNNGRKTLSKEHTKNLKISAKIEIIDCQQIITNQKIFVNTKGRTLTLGFENLDTKHYAIISIKHKGKLEITGRIHESGKILNTETKSWLTINILALALIPLLFFITFFFGLSEPEYIIPNILTSLFLIAAANFLLKHIHSLFFIPDEIISTSFI